MKIQINTIKRLIVIFVGSVGVYLIIGSIYYYFLGNPHSKDISLEDRHQESGYNSVFDHKVKTFDDYISLYKDKISIANRYSHANSKNLTRDRIIEWNSPFEWKPDEYDPENWDDEKWEPAKLKEKSSSKCPGKKSNRYKNGILLIHGLTDSPFSMRDVGRHFLSKCFLVRALLLPGHGTRPGDLLSVTYEDWIAATKFGVDRLKENVENVYLGGFSTGGAASIHYGLTNPENKQIKAIILFSPALAVTPLGIITNWHKIYTWIPWFDRMKWLDITEDKDMVKYESFTKNAADQIHLLTTEIKKLRPKPFSFPVFIAISEEDSTVSTKETLKFFKEQKSARSRLILYTTKSGDSMGDNRIQRVVFDADPNILSFAHTSIPIAKNNPHYGQEREGHNTYVNCPHYLHPEYQYKRKLCETGENIVYGETSLKDKYTVRRLTYNPDFNGMLKRLDQFLDDKD